MERAPNPGCTSSLTNVPQSPALTTTTTTTARTMSASLSPHPKVAVLPSLPPSPSFLDEVFSHPRPWSVRLEEFDWQSSRRSSPGSAGSYAKGKEKRIAEVEDEEEDSQHRASPPEAYPPMTDETAETRRVEEVRARSPYSHPDPSYATQTSFFRTGFAYAIWSVAIYVPPAC